MSEIWLNIIDMVDTRFATERDYIAHYDSDCVSLSDAIEAILKDAGVEYTMEEEDCFESPGYDTGAVFAAWIEKNGKLKSISFQWEVM